VACGWEAGHVDADLRDDDLRDRVTDARHRGQQLGGGAKGSQHLPEARLHLTYGLPKSIDLPQMQPEEEAVVLRYVPAQSLDEDLALCLQAAMRQVGQMFRIQLPGSDRLEDRATAQAQDVADQACDLQIRVLERLLDAQGVLRDLAYELLACTGQVA
jgi:hypothetical protein